MSWQQFNPSKEDIDSLGHMLVQKYHTSLYNGKKHSVIAMKQFQNAQFTVANAIIGFCQKYNITSLSEAGATWYRDVETSEYKIFVPENTNKRCLFFTINEEF